MEPFWPASNKMTQEHMIGFLKIPQVKEKTTQVTASLIIGTSKKTTS